MGLLESERKRAPLGPEDRVSLRCRFPRAAIGPVTQPFRAYSWDRFRSRSPPAAATTFGGRINALPMRRVTDLTDSVKSCAKKPPHVSHTGYPTTERQVNGIVADQRLRAGLAVGLDSGTGASAPETARGIASAVSPEASLTELQGSLRGLTASTSRSTTASPTMATAMSLSAPTSTTFTLLTNRRRPPASIEALHRIGPMRPGAR